MSSHYKTFDLYLNSQENEQLLEIGDKYQWASVLWHIALPGSKPGHFVVYQADAWEWKEVVDQERKGFLPLAKGLLRRKVTELYNKIV